MFSTFSQNFIGGRPPTDVYPVAARLGDCGDVIGHFALPETLVVIGSGLKHFVAEHLERVVTCGNLSPVFGGAKCLHLLQDGEQHKNTDNLLALWQAFASGNVQRKDIVIACGGGTVTDLVGFACATWMRGITWLAVPTTLLAMIDASVGGKTGCDLPQGKNLVGTFHPPKMVVVDTDFLETLPPREMRNGWAEMIKHEVIGGLPHCVRPDGKPSAETIAANLAVKVAIVQDDPLETRGLRAKLNAGHTVAHALEALTGFGDVSHGEAVAIGCVVEARLAVTAGVASTDWPDELAARFDAAKLPTRLPDGVTLAQLMPFMRRDKKNLGQGKLRFALPCGWGDVKVTELPLI